MASQTKTVSTYGAAAPDYAPAPVSREPRRGASQAAVAKPGKALRLAKRGFDIAFSGAVILALLPLLLLISAALLIADGRPIFFKQSRIGRDGRMFDCLKFRSMAKDADVLLERMLVASPEARREWETTHKLKNDPRIHPLGRFLRRTSLDELPQFINVLLGQMSVVGPRPITTAEAPRYGEHFAYYTAVRPGITGLWQVSGRNAVSYQRRVEFDRDYVTKLSFARDLTIVTKTVTIVLKGDGDHQ